MITFSINDILFSFRCLHNKVIINKRTSKFNSSFIASILKQEASTSSKQNVTLILHLHVCA